ncbi:MAG TPA: tRNA (adenosine(37)-N6)-dimethylallyltransferase MiaA [Rhodanobacteraceae bacterium]|nr:tRNA (adenosine(37)-N6)-dimethylallyltransferase MiaA [Rhodanobacteraceae bacterium]
MPADRRPLAVYLMGPTASGKSGLACALAGRFPLDLVSVDSALVYRGMDIGTAKPDPATMARCPHALIDIRDPSRAYSAAEFHDDALAAMHASRARGRVPLLVGGTGLYFQALQRGLSSLPPADPALRARLGAEAETAGWPALHARLASLDPRAAARIRPRDAQRIQRALEVIELTGQPLSAQQRRGARRRFPFRVLRLVLMPERGLLHRRIEARLDTMLRQGFLDEVRALRARGDLAPELPSMRAVGYRQAWRHLDGVTDAATFRAEALAATRQLAKRQVTWLRSQLDARWLPQQGPPLQAEAVGSLQAFLPKDVSASGKSG